MSFHQMAERPVEPDEQGVGTEAAAAGSPGQVQGPTQGPLGKQDGYITYAEMRELECNIGELLHEIADFCITFTTKSHEKSSN